jgi:hypothetical protein
MAAKPGGGAEHSRARLASLVGYYLFSLVHSVSRTHQVP